MAAKARRKRTSWGRRIAFAICFLFAIAGAVPVIAGIVVRTAWFQEWAAAETQRLLEQQLNVDATYSIHVRPWPLSIDIDNVVVAASDGGGPFATIEHVRIRPGLFSLLAGKLNVGDVEVTGARARVVVRDGKLQNLDVRTPPSTSTAAKGPAPLPAIGSIALTDADVDLDIDGVRAVLREVDADLTARDGAYEISLRTGAGELVRARAVPGHPDETAVDEDSLCRLEGRVRIEPGVVTVRRLTLVATTDFDPDPDTRPSCKLAQNDWRNVSLELAGLRVSYEGAADAPKLRSLDGQVHAHAPFPLVHRFLELPRTTGTVDLDAQVFFSSDSILPRVTGLLRIDSPGLDGKMFADHFEGKLRVEDDIVHMTEVSATWADGAFSIPWIEVRPLDPSIPVEARDIVGDHVTLEGILRDLGAHPQAYVGWSIDHADVARFKGTVFPLLLEAHLDVHTSTFGVYDRSANRRDRQRLMSHPGGAVDGLLSITDKAVYLKGMHLVTPRTDVTTTVRLGFKDELGVDLVPGSRIDLSEVSPIGTTEIGGLVSVRRAHADGAMVHPVFEFEIKADDFSVAGLQAGNVRTATGTFAPVVIDFSNLELEKGNSVVKSNRTKVDFGAGGGANVVVDSSVNTNTAEGLALRDFFDVFKLSSDPRVASLSGIARGNAEVRYVLGGAEDKCGGGLVRVRMNTQIAAPILFGQSFDSGAMDLNVEWDDPGAGLFGMNVDIYSASLREGTGSILAEASVRHGGVLHGNMLASGLAIPNLDGLGAVGSKIDGEASAIGKLSGTLARMRADVDVSLTPIRIGADLLPASHFAVAIEPEPTAPSIVGHTPRCQSPLFGPSPKDAEASDGRFLINGEFFDGQVRLADVSVSRQENMVIGGDVFLSDLDIGKLAHIAANTPGKVAPFEGKLTAKVHLDRLTPRALGATKGTVELYDFNLSSAGRVIELDDPPDETSVPVISIEASTITVPTLHMALQDAHGLRVAFSAFGTAKDVFTAPSVDATADIGTFDLAKLKPGLDGIDRLAGTLSGSVSVVGPLVAPRVSGEIKLRDGALSVSGAPVSIDDAVVDLAIGGGEIRVVRANATVGGGTVDVTGRVPLVGLSLGTGTANITARSIKVPIDEGIGATVSGDLVASYKPDPLGGRSLPDLQGTVRIDQFLYSRPIALDLSLGSISKGIKRTEVQVYDPANDLLTFDLNVVSPRPLRVQNDLVDMKLEIDERGIQVSGTNQRFGARGTLRILSDSKVRLRNHEFDVREGFVHFDDPTKVKADVDVRAVTEFKRTGSSEETADTSGATSGQWDISIRAHGPTEDLKLDLVSDPPLDQEDILLLLTLGMTRAEVDRGLASSLGETVGLEALSALTGADKAIQAIVPIIDYFHFGSSYSSHTGRSEPNATVGKRITEDLSASVTKTLTEGEVRATLEWRLKKGLSVQANYDNTSDVNSTIGNLGADLRWHLEFE
ncbi:MAG: translocation/assembly module TamB domain-containing protein [Polyangiaceae bacterium]